jgi:hypothetical protein
MGRAVCSYRTMFPLWVGSADGEAPLGNKCGERCLTNTRCRPSLTSSDRRRKANGGGGDDDNNNATILNRGDAFNSIATAFADQPGNIDKLRLHTLNDDYRVCVYDERVLKFQYPNGIARGKCKISRRFLAIWARVVAAAVPMRHVIV